MYPITYAGVGARQTPLDTLTVMNNIGYNLYNSHDAHLVSGGARGADSAFALLVPTTHKTIWTPSDVTQEALAFSSTLHPNWGRCSSFAKHAHGRNAMILLGKDLTDPVDFMICWTRKGLTTGGTGQAIRIAASKQIPCFNLADEDAVHKLNKLIDNLTG